ncbi:trypsin-like serine protease [Streptomyces sp. H72]
MPAAQTLSDERAGDHAFSVRLHIGEGDAARGCSAVLVHQQWLLTATCCFAPAPGIEVETGTGATQRQQHLRPHQPRHLLGPGKIRDHSLEPRRVRRRKEKPAQEHKQPAAREGGGSRVEESPQRRSTYGSADLASVGVEKLTPIPGSPVTG